MTGKPRSAALDVDGARWVKSSFSGGSGDCVELASVTWSKSSSSSGSGDCVEVADVEGGVAVRDSKNPEQAPLVFTAPEFRAFLAGARAGEFDHLV